VSPLLTIIILTLKIVENDLDITCSFQKSYVAHRARILTISEVWLAHTALLSRRIFWDDKFYVQQAKTDFFVVSATANHEFNLFCDPAVAICRSFFPEHFGNSDDKP